VEEALDPEKSDGYVYFASKLLAERALWEFVKEHPQLDVVTSKSCCTSASLRNSEIYIVVLPSFVFGPYAETYPRPFVRDSLGINRMLHSIMKGPGSYQIPPFIVDVRDVAKSHVLAMDLPRNPGALERRYIVNGGKLTWREAVDHLRISHPELNLPPTEEYPEMPGPAAIIDTSNTIADLNFGKFREPTQVIDDAVVALQEVEKTWV
jgi:nucleoside-diphosphate-sugar epimerase